MAGEPRRRPTASVRVRATLAAVAGVALASAVGAALLLVVLRGLLTDEIADAARLQTEELAATLTVGDPALPSGDAEDDVVQLVAADGRVLAASRQAAGLPPLVWPPPPDRAEVVGPVDREPLVAVAHRLPDGRVLLVARTVDARDDTLAFVGSLLATGLPVLLLVVGGLTWYLVGRALRPVEAVRREVDEISSAEMDRRVPEPAGDDEIARLARTMNRMLGRLEQAQLRQRRFTSDASHELRSPVAAIRQAAEVALAHPDRTTVPELARTVLDEDLRVQRTVEDLLLLARADEHTLRLGTDPVDLDDLVFAQARRLREATGLRVDTTAVSAGRVRGDLAALDRVLDNLTRNAARHARSRLTLALAETATGVVLTVDDDGYGIPAAERARVLERFVRLDDARARDHGGTGLGLAIVAELVRAHGGALHVEDAPGGGARMRVWLPPSAGEPAHPRTAAPPANPGTRRAAAPRPPAGS